MALTINRVWIRCKRCIRPGLTDEVIAAYYFRCREQSVQRLVLRITRIGAVSRGIRVGRSGAAEISMRVIDTRIEYGDSDTGAIKATLLNGSAAHIRHGLGKRHLVIEHGP